MSEPTIILEVTPDDEFTEQLTAEEAIALVGEIRETQGRITEDLYDMMSKIERLHRGRGWIALGYSSWAECCEMELTQAMAWDTLEDRLKRTAALQSAQLSMRAIASVLGVSKTTTSRDLALVSQNSVSTTDAGVIRVNALNGDVQQTFVPEKIEERRKQVRELKTSGLAQKEIAAKLGVSQSTISNDFEAISSVNTPQGLAKLQRALAAGSGFESRLHEDARKCVDEIKSSLRYLSQDVVNADEWLEDDVREAVIHELTPAVADYLLVLAEIAVGVAEGGLPNDSALRLRWSRTLADAAEKIAKAQHASPSA